MKSFLLKSIDLISKPCKLHGESLAEVCKFDISCPDVSEVSLNYQQ